MSERALNGWYLTAVLASLPGLVLLFAPSMGLLMLASPPWVMLTAPALTIAAVLALAAGVLGFANRRSRKDVALAAAMALYALVLGGFAVIQWMFFALAVTE